MKVPKILKKANIIPLFKSGARTSPDNYRPISLTPIISKISEKVVKKRCEAHLEFYNIFSVQQHGFRKGFSTSTNLLKFTNYIFNCANQSKSVSIVYTDLRKAFDSVPHRLLLLKLRNYGISGKTASWLEDFLSERQQRVCVGEAFSEYMPVLSGVPQGGVLSGLLFALYINDLPSQMNHCSISLYADDAKLFSEITDSSSIDAVQKDINRMVRWCKEWKLTINPTKCCHIQYNPRASSRRFSPTYYIEDNPITLKQNVKDLGIIISSNFKFHDQVKSSL